MARRKGSVFIYLNNIEELRAAHRALLAYRRTTLEDYEAAIVERQIALKIYELTGETV